MLRIDVKSINYYKLKNTCINETYTNIYIKEIFYSIYVSL